MDKNYSTTLAHVSLSETGERSFTFERNPGADTQLTKEELNQDILSRTKIFHFGSLSLTNEPAREATYEAIKIAKQNGAIISYDPNYRALLWESQEAAMEQMRGPLELVDILKISDEECELITGHDDINVSCKLLLNQGIKVVVITLGKAGALIGHDGKVRHVVGCGSTGVVDTTGAGDSFWGGFLYSLYNIEFEKVDIIQLAECAKFANAVASLCIEEFGAIKAMPTLEQVYSRLRGE